jgi:hypothetical protein
LPGAAFLALDAVMRVGERFDAALRALARNR